MDVKVVLEMKLMLGKLEVNQPVRGEPASIS